MLKRLERDATKADLAAVEALLNARSAEDDPIGHLQFSRRRDDLNQRLQQIEGRPSTNAEVGLFFGGRPVLGSYGIQADFGANAIAEFQKLVSSAHAVVERPLGTRGPVPQRDRTQLMLTDVARGSFGFILQQAEDPQLVDSAMKNVLERTTDLIFRVASPDQESFDNIAEDVDNRLFNALRSFFKVLGDAGATLRIVEDRREFTLHRDEVELARERTETSTLHETEETAEGLFYFLPDGRRFELDQGSDAGVLKGTVSPACMDWLTSSGTQIRPGILGTFRRVQMRVREIRGRGHRSHKSYTLLTVID
ncbi:hypothetical protein AZC_0111 [Azorhizobium caulinodans ORS 571]|uniref:Uncharacterized protein n=1 Tax=Azorhizobium caulinodans (strain ATCC 43989 / DSM 5975 / JCM 20966 / LMG 6465 / NBRC 14845 / NCIMB 13405 / ORS 571) TaxID=438753 RepID=A8IGN1_AZOC5|nr:hypothetical protein [Azorhizobium caulinodans]BAF86109.1 hypothetical protein AZC_0111 [Azorhizobium caulinodans ORS 571]